MTHDHIDADRHLDAWLHEDVAAPGGGLRRRVLEDVHRTPQRAGWLAGPWARVPGRRLPAAVRAIAGIAASLVLVIGLGQLVARGPAASASMPGPSATPGASTRSIPLPGLPATLAADASGAIVALRDGAIVRVRTEGTVEVLAQLGVEPCGVPLSTADAIYVAGCDARIHRIAAATGEVTAFAGGGRQLAGGPQGGIWILDAARRSAVLADGTSGAHRVEVDLHAFATGVVEGFERIWVVGEGNARLTALDPQSGDILAVVDLEHEPTFALAVADAVYAVSAGSRVIDIIDPVSGAVGESIDGLPALATSAAVGPSGVWVGSADGVLLLDPVAGVVLDTVSMPGTSWVAGHATRVWALATGAAVVVLLDDG